LLKQNENLEIIVEERTKELKKAQLEKLLQLNKFAEIGRLSSGIFHDMANLLTALSLNLERVQHNTKEYIDEPTVKFIKDDINSGMEYLDKMGAFIESFRKQFSAPSRHIYFSPIQEVNDVLMLMAYKIQASKVQLKVSNQFTAKINGDPIKFFQVIKNLVNNALDAFDTQASSKVVSISLRQEEAFLKIRISDNGLGIPDDNLPLVFEPFFTTKGPDKGTGLGLAICKDIAEKDFGGSLFVTKNTGCGVTFVFEIPLNEKQSHST
jgi:C4-dicarboxylate-specific signal transduction histidine kinase